MRKNKDGETYWTGLPFGEAHEDICRDGVDFIVYDGGGSPIGFLQAFEEHNVAATNKFLKGIEPSSWMRIRALGEGENAICRFQAAFDQRRYFSNHIRLEDAVERDVLNIVLLAPGDRPEAPAEKKSIKFTGEQLVFIVDLAMIAGMDRIESCIPDTISLAEFIAQEGEILRCIAMMKEVVGMNLACLYSQTTGDGLGIGDALEASGFDNFADKFVSERIDPDWKPSEDDSCYPSTKLLAEKFVEKMWN